MLLRGVKCEQCHAERLVTDAGTASTASGAPLVGYYEGTDLKFAGKVRAGLIAHARRELAGQAAAATYGGSAALMRRGSCVWGLHCCMRLSRNNAPDTESCASAARCMLAWCRTPGANWHGGSWHTASHPAMSVQ